MNFKQAYVRKPVLKWPGNKTGKAYHTTGTIPVVVESARTAERIEQETKVLRTLRELLARPLP